MSKIEMARQLAKQTAEQGKFMENFQPEDQANRSHATKEVQDFLRTLHEVHQLGMSNQQALMELKLKVYQVEKDHWKQVRMLIWWIMFPLMMSIISLLMLSASR